MYVKRGVVTLSIEETALLQQLTAESHLRDARIATILSTTTHTGGPEEKIELSQDEAESLLDLLPIPSSQEPDTLTSLRTHLLEFLQNL